MASCLPPHISSGYRIDVSTTDGFATATLTPEGTIAGLGGDPIEPDQKPLVIPTFPTPPTEPKRDTTATDKRFPVLIPENSHDAWSIEGAELVQSSDSGAMSLFFGNPKWTDYDFSIDAKNVGGGPTFTLWFRQGNWLNPYQNGCI